MSLESGRKLGLISSLIYVIAPVIIVVLYGLLLFSIFNTVSGAFSHGGSSSPFGFAFLSYGIVSIGFIGVAVVSLIGVILFLVAMHELSHYYNAPEIFKNVVYSIITVIAGAAIFIALLIIAVLTTISRANSSSTTISVPVFAVGFLTIIIGAFVVGIVSVLFFKRAFNMLAEKSGVHSFDTTGLLILIGVIIPFVSWIGWIFALIGFNSLKPKPTEAASAYTIPAEPQNTMQNKYCPYCGAANIFDATYCGNCGKKLQ